MKGRVIHSVEESIIFSVTPACNFVLPALLVRICKFLFVDVLFTVVAALVMGSFTLLFCGYLDGIKQSQEPVIVSKLNKPQG